MNTVVRLTDSDMAHMVARCQSLLTPEGAQAWYRNDVGALLVEVALLRSEVADARDLFASDGVADIGTLHELVEAWKANATGLYEKAQIRKLREQAQAAQRDADHARASLALMQGSLDELAEQKHALELELAATVEGADQSVSLARLEIEQERNNILSLRQDMQDLRQELESSQRIHEAAMEADRTRNYERLTRANALIEELHNVLT